jgi:hypothetical protein
MDYIKNFRRALNAERLRDKDISQTIADYAIIPGRVMINAMGEAYADVNFQVKFVDLPYFTYGFETKEGDRTFAGESPTGTAHVSEWKTIERLPNGVFYTGAKIQIVTTGRFYQKMILNFQFAGTALTNPSI